MPGVNQKVAEVEEILGDSGRVLLRYSGTENICRVMVEGPKLQQVQQLANQIADEVRKQIGTPKNRKKACVELLGM